LSQEQVFSDFSGGMNALAAVDKLDPKECLVAENVRLDETGNILSAGAMTAQNTSAYKGTPFVVGTATSTPSNIHSQYWNPSIGAVAGVGQDVFIGRTLGGMASSLASKNAMQQKMSFASTPNQIFFDVGSVGYWTDEQNLLTVDWPPASAIGGTVTGPTSPGTATQLTRPPFGTLAWTTPNNIISTSSLVVTTASTTASNFQTQYIRATMSTNSFAVSTAAVSGIGLTVVVLSTSATPPLGQMQISLLKAGMPTGTLKSQIPTNNGAFSTYTLGGSNDLWGAPWAQADINSPNFGFQLQFLGPNGPGSVQAFGGQLTIYQGAGFTAGTGAAGGLSGTYTWKQTFVAVNGEESDASNDSNSVVLANQQGTLTALGTGDNRTVARNIYRKGGTLTSYYLVGTIQDNLSTTYSDNQTDLAALSQGTILAGDVPGDFPNTRFNGGPGNGFGRFPEYHYDRLFWVNPNKPNQIFWSKPLNDFAYPTVNFIDVGDSKPISRIVSIFGELIIIKTDGIWRLTGTDESSFDLTKTPSAVGTDMSFTVVANPDKIIFTNRYGLWVFNGYTAQPLTPKLDLWFKQLNRTNVSIFSLTGFYPPEVASATVPLNFEAVGNSEKYVLSYAEAGQAANNSILVFDLKHGNITKRSNATAIAAAQLLSLAMDHVNGYVYVGDGAGFVSLLDDWNGTKQLTANTNFDFQHGYQDLQRGSNKSLWALELYLNTNGQTLTPYVYYDDGTSSETLAAITATGLQRVVRPVQAAASRKMQNFSVRLNGTLTAVNASGTPQIQVVHIKAMYDVKTGRARTGQ
jgi:hypothetical protein